MKLKKPILSGLLSISLLFNLIVPAFAYNSTGSTEDRVTGSDEVQKTVTEYLETTNTSCETQVYATRSSTFTVLVPKTIMLSGSTGLGQYVVGAKGDVLAEDSITIEPDSDTITLFKVGTTDVTVYAAISQNKDPITGAQIEAAGGNTYVTREGSIQANGLKAGSWKSTVTFNISLNETNVPETIEYEPFTVDASNRGKVGYTGAETELVIDPTFYDDDTGKYYKVTAIGARAFLQCTGLTSVTIPDSVTSIGNDAFGGCHDLTSVTIPSSVTTIGQEAFYGCTALTSIAVSSSVTTIGQNAFGDCFSLTSIEVSSDNPNYSSVDGVLFNKDQTTLIQYPGGKEGNPYIVPEGVTTICDYTFSDCTNLTSVKIPDSVTSIGNYAFYLSDLLFRTPTVIYDGDVLTNFADWGVERVEYSDGRVRYPTT